MDDTRNLVDEYKGMPNEQVFAALDKKRTPLEIAIENVEHDFNIGTIVPMCTDKYLEIVHHHTLEDFLSTQKGRELVAIENNTPRAEPLHNKKFIQNTTLIFGSENNGITPELLEKAHDVRYIESFGSTRSVNVGVAAGIAMYEYTRQLVF